MVHEVKNRKKQLPQLGIIIKLGLVLWGLAAVTGLIHAFGATFATIVAVYLTYRGLRLILRLFGLLLAAVFTFISIFILFLIATLLII